MTKRTREERKKGAEAKKVEFRALSTEDKIALIRSRPGNSKKELERLGVNINNIGEL